MRSTRSAMKAWKKPMPTRMLDFQDGRQRGDDPRADVRNGRDERQQPGEERRRARDVPRLLGRCEVTAIRRQEDRRSEEGVHAHARADGQRHVGDQPNKQRRHGARDRSGRRNVSLEALLVACEHRLVLAADPVRQDLRADKQDVAHGKKRDDAAADFVHETGVAGSKVEIWRKECVATLCKTLQHNFKAFLVIPLTFLGGYLLLLFFYCGNENWRDDAINLQTVMFQMFNQASTASSTLVGSPSVVSLGNGRAPYVKKKFQFFFPRHSAL